MWHEISRESIPIATVEAAELAWHNDILAVRIPIGIQLFEFTFDIQSYEKKLNWRISLIRTSKSSPTADLLPKSYLKSDATNTELSQIILDPGLWPQNPHMLESMTSVKYFEWSPTGMIYNNESVLAVLTNVGVVEIYAHRRHDWENKLNISMIIKDKYFPSDLNDLHAFEENLQVIKSLETTAVCWGPKLQDGSCYFVTAQRDGKILIWKLQFQFENKAEIICEIPTEFGDAISLLWIPRSTDNFSIICSNNMGQIYCLDCLVSKDIKVNRRVILWADKDRMVAKYFQYSSVSDKVIIFTHKNRHLVVLAIDNQSSVISQVIKNVNDYRITSISCINNVFYVTTINSIYEISFEVQDQIIVNLNAVEIKDNYHTYDFISLSGSKNGVIWAVAMIDRKVKHRKSQLTMDIVFLTQELQSRTELNTILDNPSNSLTHMWDCIELIRYKAMKQKILPSINYNALYQEGIHNNYKLKIYLIFATLYNVLDKIMRNGSKGLLPETSVAFIKDQILAANALSMINKLCECCHRKPKLLSKLQQEHFAGSRKFLEYFCRKYNIDIQALTDSNTINLVDLKLQYTCQGCDTELQEFSCENGHINTFCSKTFTLVENDDYLTCKSCDNIARTDMCEDYRTCVFCDLYLNNYQFLS